MMKILLVEDDSYKSSAIISWIREEYKNASVVVKSSYRDGCLAVFNSTFDLLILDMSLPARSQNSGGGEDTIVNGGELIIREMLDEGILFHAVILTQYETFNGETIEAIDERLRYICGDSFCGCISYNSQDDSWKNNLKIIIDNVNCPNC